MAEHTRVGNNAMSIKRIAVITTLLLAAAMLLAWLMNVTPAQAAIEDDLVACWDLDEESGTRYDSAGSNHLTDNNTVGYTSGVIGNAANFVSANSEYLSIADNAALSITSDLTLMVWLKRTGIASHASAAGKGEDYNAIGADNGANAWIKNSAGTFKLLKPASGDIGGTWHQIVLRFDDSTNTLTTRDNDTTTYTLTDTGDGIYDSTSEFRIGRDPWGYANYPVDLVAVWSRKLSDSEVTDLYNSGSGRDCDYIVNAATPTPTVTPIPPTATPVPTATPEVNTQYTITLTSGNPAAIDRSMTYGDIALVTVVALFGGSLMIMAIVYLIKRWVA